MTIDPNDTEEMLARRNALVDAARHAVPGLLEARLVRVDERTWIDLWRWASAEDAEAAARHVRAGRFPEADAALELAHVVTTSFTEIIDER